MYQPALRPDQIRALYYLKLKLARPMTELAQDAVDEYLRPFGGPLRIVQAGQRADCQQDAGAAEIS